ncbi:MAG: NUDIX hydrolase [Candidatus Paceibacterota bacterium]|jgi:ADP-ribose pyrophosphatase YjhB (NUDIX family)
MNKLFEPTIPSNGLDDWYAGVFLVNTKTRKVPLVRDQKKDNPRWKFPGGGKEGKETPEETVVRELRQETGLIIDEQDLILIYEGDKSNYRAPHTMFLFMICVEDTSDLIPVGDEGEDVREFDLADLPGMVGIATEDGLLFSHWTPVKDIVMQALA